MQVQEIISFISIERMSRKLHELQPYAQVLKLLVLTHFA